MKHRTKQSLAARYADETGIMLKDAKEAVDTFINIVKDEIIAGKGLQIRGFGTFVVRQQSVTLVRDFKSGKQVPYKPKDKVYFKSSIKV